MIEYKGLVFDTWSCSSEEAVVRLAEEAKLGFHVDFVKVGGDSMGLRDYRERVFAEEEEGYREYTLDGVVNALDCPLVFGDEGQIKALRVARVFEEQINFLGIISLDQLREAGFCDGKI
jgi:hypothetical protein